MENISTEISPGERKERKRRKERKVPKSDESAVEALGELINLEKQRLLEEKKQETEQVHQKISALEEVLATRKEKIKELEDDLSAIYLDLQTANTKISAMLKNRPWYQKLVGATPEEYKEATDAAEDLEKERVKLREEMVKLEDPDFEQEINEEIRMLQRKLAVLEDLE